jgi:DNA repair protein RadC
MIQSNLKLDDYSSTNLSPPVACGEMPQVRFDRFGAKALSDTELLALVLQNGVRGCHVLTLASRLVAEAGSVAGLTQWDVTDFQRLKGIGQAKAKQLVAMIEIARRMMREPQKEKPVLNRPELVAEYFRPIIHGLSVEKFWVLCLNRKNRLIKCVEITSGTATSTLAHPREVFRAAIQEPGTTCIICTHSHPSGDPSPSAADVSITRQLRDASRTVDIDLADHVVLGRPESDPTGLGFYSFRSAGIL